MNSRYEGLRSAAWAATCTALVVLISLVDFVSGPDLTFSLFYFTVIVLASWQIAKLPHVIIGAIGIAAFWLAADWFTLGAPQKEILLWNAAMRLVILIGLGVMVCRLRRALVNEQVLARTDSLTGALNVRAFRERAAREIARAQRHRNALTVAYIDVDDFKRVNDQYGHSFGDRVLRNVAAALRASLRKTDTLARVGGDEFVILLPETGTDNARQLMARLQSIVAEAAPAEDRPVTFSIGAVVFAEPPSDVDALIQAADSLMYKAKAEGKNRAHVRASTPSVAA